MVSGKSSKSVDELFFELIYKIISLKTEKNLNGLIGETEKYKGYYLTSEERTALKDLENCLIENLNIQGGYVKKIAEVIEESGIPIVYEIDHSSFGIKIEDGHVVGIGLFNCYLKMLPDSFFSFTILIAKIIAIIDIITNAIKLTMNSKIK